MAKYPWPQRCHPILVELIERTCACFENTVVVAYAKPYFGYRDNAEQLALWMQGRAPLWDVNLHRERAGLSPLVERENQRTVTNAKPGESKHNFGIESRAADLVIVQRGGKHLVWDAGADLDDDNMLDYEELGECGESQGLVWGGRWKLRDWGHFELPDEGTPEMEAIYRYLSPDPALAGVGNPAMMVSHYDMTEGVERERRRRGYPV